LVSSSPGIKFADADRYNGSEDSAVVIYYPHLERAGIKEAFQVQCTRLVPDTRWTCDDVQIRRYLALDSQDYEVRVTGPIDSEAAVALIEATRKVLPVADNENSDVPVTAMLLSSYDDSAHVVWVNFAGEASLIIRGRVSAGGDPTRVDDWVVETQ